MATATTYAIAHSGSYDFYRTGIKTLLGAKRLAKQGIAQSHDGLIEVLAEHHDETCTPYRETVAILHGYSDKWINV